MLKKEFFRAGKLEECPIYDLHGHMGPWRSIYLPKNDPASMVELMKKYNVKLLAFCHHAALFCPEIGNLANIEAVRKFPEHLRAYCAINPNYPEMAEKDIETFEQYRDVYVGFKFLADYHQVPITDPRYQPSWEFAEQKKLLVLLHTWGGSMYDGPEQIEKIAKKYTCAKILLGHSCHGEWDKAVRLVKDFPNIYLELCAVLDERGILEKFITELGSERIVFGTDFPWMSHLYYLGGVLGAGLSNEDIHNILHRNAERLLNFEYS